MNESSGTERLQNARATAWRTTVLLVSTLLVVSTLAGMGYLVYRGEVSEEPLVLLVGVLFGYLLRVSQMYL